jgi:hypothetical protein
MCHVSFKLYSKIYVHNEWVTGGELFNLFKSRCLATGDVFDYY